MKLPVIPIYTGLNERYTQAVQAEFLKPKLKVNNYLKLN